MRLNQQDAVVMQLPCKATIVVQLLKRLLARNIVLLLAMQHSRHPHTLVARHCKSAVLMCSYSVVIWMKGDEKRNST